MSRPKGSSRVENRSDGTVLISWIPEAIDEKCERLAAAKKNAATTKPSWIGRAKKWRSRLGAHGEIYRFSVWHWQIRGERTIDWWHSPKSPFKFRIDAGDVRAVTSFAEFLAAIDNSDDSNLQRTPHTEGGE